MKYEGLDRVFEDVRGARLEGRRVEIFKTDLADAFRHLIIATPHCGLFGFTLDNVDYVDTCLPFGCRSSPLPVQPLCRGSTLDNRTSWYQGSISLPRRLLRGM
jgi:hypothetical protein